MNQDNGGIIGKINTPTTSLASGVWSLDSQFDSQSSSIWPLAFPNTTIANSCRFNDGSSDYLTKTPSGAGNRRTFTISFWMKRSNISALMKPFSAGASSSPFTAVEIESTDQLRFVYFNGSAVVTDLSTSRLLRDVSAWYHIVWSVDTTQATSSDRVKLYVNGNQETSFDSSHNTYPAENFDYNFNNNQAHEIGRGVYNSAENFDGYLAEFIMIDGQQLLPTSFGAFNPVTNIWEPVAYAGTYGTNGFRLDFADSSALGNDVSGNDNDFTVNNLTSIDQSTDTCSNNFCTLNPLGFTEGTLSEGNLEIDQNGSAGRFCASTFQVTKGKWYFEAKLLNYGSEPRPSIGIGRNEETYTGNASQGASSIVYGLENTSVFKGNTNVFTYDSSPASGDIYGVAFDLDNLKIYFHKNGTYANSGDPANGTGNVTTLVSGTDYSPITGALNTNSNSARNNDWQFNFGSPMYSISSGNSDANGHGNFEYSVPSGFFSLCSKNLAEFGG